MLLNGDLLFHLSQLVSLHYLGKHEPQKFGFFSHAENDTDLACCIFNTH